MKIDTVQKLILAILALIVGFFLPEIWDAIKMLFGG